MAKPSVAPYGSWRSPITADLIASATVGLSNIMIDGADVYWIELRPAEGGRNIIVRRTPDGSITDVTPPPFNARTRVHEYGGGAALVADGVVYFSNFADQRLYCLDPGGEPRAITPPMPDGELRYADAVADHRRTRLVCVREDHRAADREAVNTIVALPVDGESEGAVLVSGNDFYASPRLNPDGTLLAWLTWRHPNMPWDGTELWVGQLNAAGAVQRAERVAGGPDESIFQPEWSPDGVVHFVSDRSGWWNLYRWKSGAVEPLCRREAEFGGPQWVFGMSTYAFMSAQRIICTYAEFGSWHLATLDTATGHPDPIEIGYTSISGLRVAERSAYFLAGSPLQPTSVVRIDLASRQTEVLRRASEVAIDPGYLSAPEPIEFPTEGGLTAHGFFYPPRNRDHEPRPPARPLGERTGSAQSSALSPQPPLERPPLLVISHGGPTSATSTALRLGIQYWTSRGIAVLDVNYGGSTGYGRAYRQRLDGQWGIVDVDDCVNGARCLVERGAVDGRRLAITGGSAGGYTTLCALTFREVFSAGASYYGVSDLEALAVETHKFESRYLDRLIGPYPERRDLYQARSPLSFPDQLSRPAIFFQGLEDKIVPPNQAERMVEALRSKGVPVAYLAFEGEQHGFRRGENIKRALEAELYFYSRIFGFELADPVEPVAIENLA